MIVQKLRTILVWSHKIQAEDKYEKKVTSKIDRHSVSSRSKKRAPKQSVSAELKPTARQAHEFQHPIVPGQHGRNPKKRHCRNRRPRARQRGAKHRRINEREKRPSQSASARGRALVRLSHSFDVCGLIWKAKEKVWRRRARTREWDGPRAFDASAFLLRPRAETCVRGVAVGNS